MSNPGVRVLKSTRIANSYLAIEDNIGESIHLHYGDFRLDLSIDEFCDMVDSLEESINNLYSDRSFNTKMFDANFFSDVAKGLPQLKKIETKTVKLENLIVKTKNCFGFPTYAKLKKSRVYKALNGNPKDDNAYIQENNINETNSQRTASILNSISNNGYPYDDKKIVIFNDRMEIRDGQHRAASLLYLNSTENIEVYNLTFKDEMFTSSYKNKLYLFAVSVKILLKEKIKKLYRLFYRIVDKIEFTRDKQRIKKLRKR